MSDDDVELGPIDYLVVEWPADRQPTGEAFPHLLDLVDRGLIGVLDLAFVHKEKDGSIVGVAIGDLDLDGNPEIAVFEGASSGLLSEDDYHEAGGALEPGCSAAILLFENTWAAPFARPCAAAELSSSRMAVSRSTPSSPRSTSSSPRTPRVRRRRREDMPGLLRGVARMAVVAGTATAVSNRVSRRQASRWSQQEAAQPQYAEPPPAAARRAEHERQASAAQGARRAEVQRRAHRCRVRGAEGEDPGGLNGSS